MASDLPRTSGGVSLHGSASDEEIVIVEITVHQPGNLGCFRTKSGAAALQENYDHNPPSAGVGVGGKPAEAGAGVRAGPGLAQNFFFVEVETQAACRAVLHRARHAVGDLRDQGRDIQLALDARLKIS